MSFLAGLLAQLLLGLVSHYQARADFRARVDAEARAKGSAAALAALEFLRTAAARPDGGARLPDRGGRLELPGDDPGPRS